MKEWLDREEKNVDIDRLMKLDDKVNNTLNIDIDKKVHRSWSMKWISMNNFLCYGDSNFVSFSNLNGLNIVASEPKNQGGKCLRSDTQLVIKYNPDDIVKTLGFLPDELK